MYSVRQKLAEKFDRTPEEDDMLDMMLNESERVNKDNLKAIIDWYDSLEGTDLYE